MAEDVSSRHRRLICGRRVDDRSPVFAWNAESVRQTRRCASCHDLPMGTQVVTADDIDVSVVWLRKASAGVQHSGAVRCLDGLVDLGVVPGFPEGGVFGAVTVGDDFFLLVRESGRGRGFCSATGRRRGIGRSLKGGRHVGPPTTLKNSSRGIPGCWRTSGSRERNSNCCVRTRTSTRMSS